MIQSAKSLLRDYALILGLVVIVIFAILLWPAFRTTLCEKLMSADWWADNALSLIIFGILVSWLVSRHQKRREREARRPYEEWQLVTKGFGEDKSHPIFWREVEKFLSSDFEMWKYVKSTVSNVCRIKTPDINTAKKRKWLEIDADKKRIVVHFDRMREQDIQQWMVDDLPQNWHWAEAPAPERPKTIKIAVCDLDTQERQ